MFKTKFQPYSFVLLMSLLFAACSSSKEARSIKGKIKGEWNLQTINIEGINSKFKATVFNEADFNCFIGSNWNFIANNSTGMYTIGNIPGSGCNNMTRKIRWSIFEPAGAEKEFQFKRLDDKNNPLDDNNGFRLTVVNLTETTMQLKSNITFEGKPGSIIYNFIKQ